MSQVLLNRVKRLEQSMERWFSDEPQDDLSDRIARLEQRVAFIEQNYARKAGRKPSDAGTD